MAESIPIIAMLRGENLLLFILSSFLWSPSFFPVTVWYHLHNWLENPACFAVSHAYAFPDFLVVRSVKSNALRALDFLPSLQNIHDTKIAPYQEIRGLLHKKNTASAVFISSFIQTLLSVLDSHQISRLCTGSWTRTMASPPVGNCTQPRRTSHLYILFLAFAFAH